MTTHATKAPWDWELKAELTALKERIKELEASSRTATIRMWCELSGNPLDRDARFVMGRLATWICNSRGIPIPGSFDGANIYPVPIIEEAYTWFLQAPGGQGV